MFATATSSIASANENVAIEQRRHVSLLARVPQVRVREWLAADRFVTAAIITCILLATVRVGLDSVTLFRGRRRWRPDLVDGEPVLVSTTLGPALVGILDATIVIPEWVATLPDDERALMLAHEREHRRAGDGLLASAGLLGALCMPWNPALWWMFRRLRTAIEVDCDRRVLRMFPDVERYGRLLVSVAERASSDSSFAITGFSERAGSLARRIRAMTTRAGGGRYRREVRIPVVARGVACAAATMAVFVVTPPMPAARLAESTAWLGNAREERGGFRRKRRAGRGGCSCAAPQIGFWRRRATFLLRLSSTIPARC